MQESITNSVEARLLLHGAGGEVSVETLLNLLQHVGNGLSLNAASRKTGCSWRHAWSVIRNASAIAGLPLLESSIGGSGGGGSCLTGTGKEVQKILTRIRDDVEKTVSTPCREMVGDTIVFAATLEAVETGLASAIGQHFLADTGVSLLIIGTGSGVALQLAEAGSVDLVLTHAPEREGVLVEQGILGASVPTMRSSYVIVGPCQDPAGVGQAEQSNDLKDAIRRIAVSGAGFVSRGDNSGTHLREQALWRAAGIQPVAPWYRVVGSGGNREVLRQAALSGSYALIDQATVRLWGTGPDQAIVYRDRDDKHADLTDTFSFSPVLPGASRSGVAGYRGATRFLEWWSPRSESLVRSSAVDSNGAALFAPVQH